MADMPDWSVLSLPPPMPKDWRPLLSIEVFDGVPAVVGSVTRPDGKLLKAGFALRADMLEEAPDLFRWTCASLWQALHREETTHG